MLALTALLALVAIVVLHVVEHRKQEAEKRSAHLFYDRLNHRSAYDQLNQYEADRRVPDGLELVHIDGNPMLVPKVGGPIWAEFAPDDWDDFPDRDAA